MILSVSQVESFDSRQTGGCPRRWWFSSVRGLRPEQTTGQSDGEKGHELLAAYFRTGELPPKRAKLSKAVTGAIVKGDLPKPGPDMLVEERFDGQPKLNPVTGEWNKIIPEDALWLGGVAWDGFIDLAYRRGDVPTIVDHKFKSDLGDAKTRDQLIKTVQMPVYVLSQLPYWPDATRWELMHNNICRTGVESRLVRAVVTTAQVLERKEEIEKIVDEMKLVAEVETQNDVPAVKRSCQAYGGCPHQSICSAFKQRSSQVELTDEEAAVFAGLDDETPVQPEPQKRRMQFVDAPADPPAGPPGPPPEPAKPAEEPAPVCQCGAQVTKDNGSKLQSGAWKHVGCPLDAPPAPPPAAPKQRRAKAAPEAQAPLPLAPEHAAPVSTVSTTGVQPVALALGKREHAIADVLESIARLLRA